MTVRDAVAQQAHAGQSEWLKPLDDQVPLARAIAERLAGAIVQGTLTPGTKLNEEELATVFHTSRTPVREALRLLEREGMVSAAPRRGVRVSEITLGDAAEVYLCRGYLVGLASKLATMNATPSEIDSLRDLQAALEETLTLDDRERYVRIAIKFDEILVEMARNPLLETLLESLHRRLLRFSISVSLPRNVIKKSFQKRRGLLDAIESRQPVQAEMVMRELIAITWEGLDKQHSLVDGSSAHRLPMQMHALLSNEEVPSPQTIKGGDTA